MERSVWAVRGHLRPAVRDGPHRRPAHLSAGRLPRVRWTRGGALSASHARPPCSSPRSCCCHLRSAALGPSRSSPGHADRAGPRVGGGGPDHVGGGDPGGRGGGRHPGAGRQPAAAGPDATAQGASTAASVPSVLGFIAAATSGDEALLAGRRRASRWPPSEGWPSGSPPRPGVAAVGSSRLPDQWPRLRGGLRPLPLVRAGHRREHHATACLETGWRRYRRLLRRSRVWLLAPTWIALNAGLGLYTSQTLFQLVRSPTLASRTSGSWAASTRCS